MHADFDVEGELGESHVLHVTVTSSSNVSLLSQRPTINCKLDIFVVHI